MADEVGAVLELGSVDRFGVYRCSRSGVGFRPLGIEQGYADRFAYNVGMGIVRVSDGAEVD